MTVRLQGLSVLSGCRVVEFRVLSGGVGLSGLCRGEQPYFVVSGLRRLLVLASLLAARLVPFVLGLVHCRVLMPASSPAVRQRHTLLCSSTVSSARATHSLVVAATSFATTFS